MKSGIKRGHTGAFLLVATKRTGGIRIQRSGAFEGIWKHMHVIPCLSDMSWDEAYNLEGYKEPEDCNGQLLCTESCPTGEIKGKFIIDK